MLQLILNEYSKGKGIQNLNDEYLVSNIKDFKHIFTLSI